MVRDGSFFPEIPQIQDLNNRDGCTGKVRKMEESDKSHLHFNFLPKFVFVGEKENTNRCKITMSEPVLVNPNSYKNLEIVLEKVKNMAIDNCDIEWMFIGADGPPYCIMSRLISRDPEKYDWVSIVEGLGHLNMNQIKTFFSICNVIFLESLAKDLLNFSNIKAYDYFYPRRAYCAQ